MHRGKNEKVIGIMNDKLGGKIMTEFAVSRAKACSYLIDYSDENKKIKCTKEATQLENKINLEKNDIEEDSRTESYQEFVKTM